MKKLVLAGVVSLVSAATLADQPLTIQNSTPATLGTSPNYVSDASNQDQNKFSVKLGYAGNKIDSNAYARLKKIEPYRVCRRVNILRDYPDDKIKIYP